MTSSNSSPKRPRCFLFSLHLWTNGLFPGSPQEITELARALTDFWMPWSLRLSVSLGPWPFGLAYDRGAGQCTSLELDWATRRWWEKLLSLRWWGIPAQMTVSFTRGFKGALETKPHHRLADRHHRLPFWGGFLAQHFAAKYSPRVRFGACHFCQLRWHPRIGTAQVTGSMQLICLYLCFRVTSWYVNALLVANSNQKSQDS